MAIPTHTVRYDSNHKKIVNCYSLDFDKVKYWDEQRQAGNEVEVEKQGLKEGWLRFATQEEWNSYFSRDYKTYMT